MLRKFPLKHRFLQSACLRCGLTKLAMSGSTGCIVYYENKFGVKYVSLSLIHLLQADDTFHLYINLWNIFYYTFLGHCPCLFYARFSKLFFFPPRFLLSL